jgi:hypothetical protein
MRRLLLIGMFLLGATAMSVAQSANTHISTHAAATATCTVGDVYVDTVSSGFYRCSAVNTWTRLADGTGTGAPSTAQYWTGAADGTLSAEKNLGALGTGLVINTAGVPSAYAGTSCTNQFPRSLNASGAATCATVSLTADVTGTLPVANGGTNLTAAADDNVMLGNGTTWQTKALTDCQDSSGNHLNYTASTNTFSCGTSGDGTGGGGTTVALSSVAAATGAATIASGNNHSIIWNWALTTNSINAFTFGETTAATNGTASGQAILGVDTLASSTADAVYIKNYGAAQSLRIDDVAGDTTPFVVDASGNVGIGTLSPAAELQVISTASGILWGGGGSDKTGILYSDTSAVWVMSSDAVDLNFTTGAGAKHFVVRHAGGSQVIFAAQDAITTAKTYLMIGDTNGITNDYYRIIGFGYSGGTNLPAYMGYQDTSNSGSTKGALVFGTRDVTTDSAPTERLRIASDGGVLIADLKTTGAATGKKMVCVDTTTGKLYASTSSTDCLN